MGERVWSRAVDAAVNALLEGDCVLLSREGMCDVWWGAHGRGVAMTPDGVGRVLAGVTGLGVEFLGSRGVEWRFGVRGVEK